MFYEPTHPHVNAERDLARSSSEHSFEPNKNETIAETQHRLRREFRDVLREANIRSLIKYVERAGMSPDKTDQISPVWKAYLKDKTFRASSWTWRNPKLFLLTPRTAAEMAIHELAARPREAQRPE